MGVPGHMATPSFTHRGKDQAKRSPARNCASSRIVTQARRHFFAYGIRGVTMDDLAGELGMSKKTLYSHFPSKFALLEAVFLDKFQSVEEDLDRIIPGCASDFISTLQQLLACVQRHTEEVQAPFVRDIRREAPEIFTLVETRRRTMLHHYFGKLFGEGQKAGIIRQDISTELLIEILLAAVQAIMNPEKLAQLGLSLTTGFSAIIAVILDGAITESGRSQL